MDQAEHKVRLEGRKVDLPSLVNHMEHKEVGMDPKPHMAVGTGHYLT